MVETVGCGKPDRISSTLEIWVAAMLEVENRRSDDSTRWEVNDGA